MTRFLLDVNVSVALIDPARQCARLVCEDGQESMGDLMTVAVQDGSSALLLIQ